VRPEAGCQIDPWAADIDQAFLSRVLDPLHTDVLPRGVDEMFWRCPICDHTVFPWRAPRHICETLSLLSEPLTTTWSGVSGGK